MDTGLLVTDDEIGKIIEAFRVDGAKVDGIYLTRLTSEDGTSEYVLRLITEDRPHDMIVRHVRLARENKLPTSARHIRYDYIRPDHAEASRVIEYAQAMGTHPVIIENAAWRGMYLDYVRVVSYQSRTTAVA